LRFRRLTHIFFDCAFPGNSAIERDCRFSLTCETTPGRSLTSNKLRIASFIRDLFSHWKDLGRRMPSPSVASNGTNVREDKTEVLAGCREGRLVLTYRLGTRFSENGWGRQGSFCPFGKDLSWKSGYRTSSPSFRLRANRPRDGCALWSVAF